MVYARRNRKQMLAKARGFSVGRATGGLIAGAKRLANSAVGRSAVKRGFKNVINRYVKTRTRNVVPFRNVKVEGTGGQLSRFIRSNPAHKLAKMMEKINPPRYIYWNAGLRLTGTPGLQCATFFPYLTGGGYLPTGLSNETQYNDLATMLFQSSGSTGLSNATANPYKTTQFVVKQATGSVKLTNQDSGNVEIILYDCVTKLDGNQDPLGCWYSGLNDEASASTFAGGTLPVGSIPQASQMFNTHYKVKQKTRILLGQGQSHVHQVNLKPNRLVRGEELYDANAYLRGLTYFCMVVASGLPANDSVTNTQVSTGAVNVDIVYTKQMQYTYNTPAVLQYIQYANNLPTSFTVSEQVMDIGSGSKQVDAPA